MNWYIRVLKKYAVFSGRARRKEYWMFGLIQTFVYIAAMILDAVLGTSGPDTGRGGVIETLVMLGTLLPTAAAGVRRMHDTDHSGWWLLVPIVNFVFLVLEGTHGPNRFGPDPKAEGDTESASATSA
ncbi:MAG: DUF805 domain-containing protein [Acidobacteria bacterium]|nr:DUF805 domain-containing protein [Acidobacteriota bacterium]